MKLLNTDTLEEARKKLLAAAAEKRPEMERAPFAECAGRILAEDLKAEENVPDFRKSTVDGYAVRAADTQGVTESIPVFLDIIETVSIGTAPRKTVGPGQAAYVPTGGMIPEGADAMVMVEYCEKFDEASIAVYESAAVGRNLIAVGEDLCKGQVFLRKGIRLRSQEVGVMSSAGVSMPQVFKPWRLTVISTGDELVQVSDLPEKGQVRDVNTHSIASAAERSGFQVVDTLVLKDEEALLEEAVGKAMAESDMVVISGGSSQGEKDHTADVLDRLAAPGVFTHGIALKPGKPTILAYDEKSETILMGLPGHPAAALMVFELLAAWLYRRKTGQREGVCIPAYITENVAAAGGRTTCLPVALAEPDDKRMPEGIPGGPASLMRAVPVFGKSGIMTTMTRADGYTLIPADTEGLKEGSLVWVKLF